MIKPTVEVQKNIEILCKVAKKAIQRVSITICRDQDGDFHE
jgi:hypothetical protein